MKGQRIRYEPEELAWLEARQDMPRVELHLAFTTFWRRPDVSFANLKALCTRMGWRTGRSGCFSKGQVAHNKGKAMPYSAASAATQFKKGQRPHSYRGPGHESTDSKDGYVWIVIAERNPYTGADTRRVQKHKWLWTQAHGPVPEGHVLKCLDGDKTNCAPENWEAIPKALLPRLVGGRAKRLPYDPAPAELKPTLLAIAKLQHAARTARA